MKKPLELSFLPFQIHPNKDGIPIDGVRIRADDSHDLGYALRGEF